MNHPRTSGIEESGTGLQCHLCGATRDAQGKKLLNPSRLLEHMRTAHPEAVSSPRFSPPPPMNPYQVYSVPKSAPLRVTAPPPPASHAKFCPQCGFDMKAVDAAMKPPHAPPGGDD
jgi:hypothetical protein